MNDPPGAGRPFAICGQNRPRGAQQRLAAWYLHRIAQMPRAAAGFAICLGHWVKSPIRFGMIT